MNLGNFITGAVITIICILPFILLRLNRKKIENNLIKSLQKLAKQYNCQIHKHDIFIDFIIGIDTRNNFVFYYKQTKNKQVEYAIHLTEIESCKIIDTSNSKDNSDGFIGLYLCLQPKSKDQKVIELEFLDLHNSYQLHVDKQPIEKWDTIIHNGLKKI